MRTKTRAIATAEKKTTKRYKGRRLTLVSTDVSDTRLDESAGRSSYSSSIPTLDEMRIEFLDWSSFEPISINDISPITAL